MNVPFAFLLASSISLYFISIPELSCRWQWPTMSTKLMPNPAYATLGGTGPLHIGLITQKMPISYWVLEFCRFHLCEFILWRVGQQFQLNWYKILNTGFAKAWVCTTVSICIISNSLSENHPKH